jgi:hypothetical protein
MTLTPWETFPGCFHSLSKQLPPLAFHKTLYLLNYYNTSTLLSYCLLFSRLGAIFEFISISPKPVCLDRYTVGGSIFVKKVNDLGLPVSQSQRRQLLSAEPVRTCLVSPEEDVKKHDFPLGRPMESTPSLSPKILSSLLPQSILSSSSRT